MRQVFWSYEVCSDKKQPRIAGRFTLSYRETSYVFCLEARFFLVQGQIFGKSIRKILLVSAKLSVEVDTFRFIPLFRPSYTWEKFWVRFTCWSCNPQGWFPPTVEALPSLPCRPVPCSFNPKCKPVAMPHIKPCLGEQANWESAAASQTQASQSGTRVMGFKVRCADHYTTPRWTVVSDHWNNSTRVQDP